MKSVFLPRTGIYLRQSAPFNYFFTAFCRFNGGGGNTCSLIMDAHRDRTQIYSQVVHQLRNWSHLCSETIKNHYLFCPFKCPDVLVHFFNIPCAFLWSVADDISWDTSRNLTFKCFLSGEVWLLLEKPPQLWVWAVGVTCSQNLWDLATKMQRLPFLGSLH